MGTSKSNTGPSNNTALEPAWANEPYAGILPTVPDSANGEGNQEETGQNSNENPQHETDEQISPIVLITGNWRAPRLHLTKFAKNPSTGNLRTAIKSYVRASGGSKAIARSVVSGKRTMTKFGGFLSSIATDGLKNTFEKFHLGEVEGRSIEIILNKIVAYLSPPGGTNEDTIAQFAIVDTLSKLYEDFGLEKNALTSLENLTSEDIQNLMLYYTSSFIYTKWIHELGMKIENKNISAKNVLLLEKRAKDFINATVKYEFGEFDLTKSNFNSVEIKVMIDDIFETAYKFVEEL